MIGARIKAGNRRVRSLLNVITRDQISTPEKVRQLREELNEHHQTTRFNKCRNMGQVLQAQLRLALEKEFRQSLG